ncbi:hypothetical protein B5X24_HaOG213674 [Helicoverpa armigera]|uniref:Uncharacterized protein n=1 Tax=Helicoverpa armigera TaxID=29058 RepID=A0A2W1BEM9_HELAM|nr:hypothetical protein B5X24_HaOG213674 [Helicoverpa armigera]
MPYTTEEFRQLPIVSNSKKKRNFYFIIISLPILPLLGCGLLSHGEGLSVNHHAYSMQVGDFRLHSPGFFEMFSVTFLSAIGVQNIRRKYIQLRKVPLVLA